MKMFFQSLEQIEQATAQLQNTACPHCHRQRHLLSHGYIYKFVAGQAPIIVGKRVFCSNRRCHQGCGRTCPLYLATCLRFIHYSAAVFARFIEGLISGTTVEAAYLKATSAFDARQAWRWLDKLIANLPRWRAALPGLGAFSLPLYPKRRRLIAETCLALQARFSVKLIPNFQLQRQQGFLS